MASVVWARRRIALALIVAAAWQPVAPPAYADESKPGQPGGGTPAPSQPAGGSGPACVVKGTYPGPKGTSIYDAASGGRAVASFSGGFQPMALSDFPADPSTGRARIATSLGTSALRIEGWVTPSAFAVFTSRDVAVSAGHVWISEAQRVKLVQATSGALGVEITVVGTGGQVVRATVPCDALALQHGTPSAMEVPGNGRGYLSKGSVVELFDEPGGNVVLALKVMEGTAQLFWSTESRAGFVHVKARGTLTIDAWARATNLDPLKKGEMMDQFIPPTTAVAGAQLALDKPPRLVQATHEVPVRAHRDDKEKPIGAIETGAEFYVMETLLGWVNVLPKNLGLTPTDDGGFWIPASEASK
jgi:hypothetical protein